MIIEGDVKARPRPGSPHLALALQCANKSAMLRKLAWVLLFLVFTSDAAKSDEPYTPWGGPVRPPKSAQEPTTRGVSPPTQEDGASVDLAEESASGEPAAVKGIGRYCIVGSLIFGPGLPLQLGEGCKSREGSTGYIGTIVE